MRSAPSRCPGGRPRAALKRPGVPAEPCLHGLTEKPGARPERPSQHSTATRKPLVRRPRPPSLCPACPGLGGGQKRGRDLGASEEARRPLLSAPAEPRPASAACGPRPGGLSCRGTARRPGGPPWAGRQEPSSSGPTAAPSPQTHSHSGLRAPRKWTHHVPLLYLRRVAGTRGASRVPCGPAEPSASGPAPVAGGEAERGTPGDLQEPAGDRSPVGPPRPPRWVRRGPPRLAGTRRAPTSDALCSAGCQRLARAEPQRVASRRRGQGPHWFNISFSFESIVPI